MTAATLRQLELFNLLSDNWCCILSDSDQMKNAIRWHLPNSLHTPWTTTKLVSLSTSNLTLSHHTLKASWEIIPSSVECLLETQASPKGLSSITATIKEVKWPHSISPSYESSLSSVMAESILRKSCEVRWSRGGFNENTKPHSQEDIRYCRVLKLWRGSSMSCMHLPARCHSEGCSGKTR